MRTEIIAELAQGYEGRPLLGSLLIKAAAHAGVDAVKLQLIYADEIATPGYKYYDLYKQLEMPLEVWRKLGVQAREAGLRFYLDVCGPRSLAEARELGADGVKISTSNFFNIPLVNDALAAMPRIFLGIGGITVAEVETFIARHRVAPDGPICFLYGLQNEPTPLEGTNLGKLAALRARFPKHQFGYMDHAEGGTDDAHTLALLALPMGAVCIEKHLTLDRALKLEDYISASTPDEMRAFVARVRRAEAALGSGSLELTEGESAYRKTKLKVVVATRNLRAGAPILDADIVLKRVEGFTCADAFFLAADVVGRVPARDVAGGEAITASVLG